MPAETPRPRRAVEAQHFGGLGVGESLIWGEYFFVEALDGALGPA